jgi:hypothetical protein
MTDDPLKPQTPYMRETADELAAEAGPIIGQLRARFGADRLVAFIEGHGQLQAMAMFLMMTATAMPQTGYSDEALDVLRHDADDVRRAADQWANVADALADAWQAQRREGER